MAALRLERLPEFHRPGRRGFLLLRFFSPLGWLKTLTEQGEGEAITPPIGMDRDAPVLHLAEMADILSRARVRRCAFFFSPVSSIQRRKARAVTPDLRSARRVWRRGVTSPGDWGNK